MSRVHPHTSWQRFRCTLGRWLVAAGCALTLVSCDQPGHLPLPINPLRNNELVVATRELPTSYIPDEENGAHGLEYELARRFAETLGRKLKVVVVKNDEELLEKLKAGRVHFAAAWLSRPSAGPGEGLKLAEPYATTRYVIAQHEASLPITDVAHLAGKTIHVVGGSRHALVLRQVLSNMPALDPPAQLVEHPEWSELDLLAAVANQRVEFALVDSLLFDLAENYYPNLQFSLEVGAPQEISWLFPERGDPQLFDLARRFILQSKEDGTLARLMDRHFGHIQRLRQGNIIGFVERMRTVLPAYLQSFKSAQVLTGVDWRLIAALAYQESGWNPLATSPTGVRGMMMLTEDTADHLEVENRLNPLESIIAGARYLAEIREQLPASAQEPDRTWLALAAYNLGQGHFNGARSIASSMQADPDSWFEMKRVLPQLARPEIYRRLKSGRARGGEAVVLVENVRVYYDILCRFHPAYRPLAPEISDHHKTLTRVKGSRHLLALRAARGQNKLPPSGPAAVHGPGPEPGLQRPESVPADPGLRAPPASKKAPLAAEPSPG